MKAAAIFLKQFGNRRVEGVKPEEGAGIRANIYSSTISAALRASPLLCCESAGLVVS